ncbi:hypothetical protein [Gluconobacter potus]|uniref:hypothetical protein n=1 Tax=Gluconobacter potus TaxID=2724927 RepID=UPI0039E7AB33
MIRLQQVGSGKKSCIVVSDDHVQKVLEGPMCNSSLHEIALLAVNTGHNITSWIREQPQLSLAQWESDVIQLQYEVPLAPLRQPDAFVCSFGYTFRYLNGVLAPEKASPDWYYKGHAGELVAHNCSIVQPYFADGLTIEAEHVAIYVIDRNGRPCYVGYSIANDVSDAKLRHEKPSLSALSKLSPTAVAPEIILGPVPKSIEVNVLVERKGERVWSRSGYLGTEHMCFPLTDLERLLFRYNNIITPGMVFFVLMGTTISSSKDWVELEHGDEISIESPADHLCLRNRLLDEAVIYSCSV